MISRKAKKLKLLIANHLLDWYTIGSIQGIFTSMVGFVTWPPFLYYRIAAYFRTAFIFGYFDQSFLFENKFLVGNSISSLPERKHLSSSKLKPPKLIYGLAFENFWFENNPLYGIIFTIIMWPDLQKPGTIPHFWKLRFLHHGVLHTYNLLL